MYEGKRVAAAKEGEVNSERKGAQSIRTKQMSNAYARTNETALKGVVRDAAGRTE